MGCQWAAGCWGGGGYLINYIIIFHTNGSCKKLASQAGQDLTHLAKAGKILARSCKLVAIFLAYLQDYESFKNLHFAIMHHG